MPQQLGEKLNTLDEDEQCITIQATTAEELEEDDESSSLLFGKYDKYFHNGDGNYERLYRIAKLILPNALYVTWRGFIDFQVEPGSPCITNKKVAEYTKKNLRTIELNMQRLRQAGFVRTHHVLRGDNWVVEKNFSGMYQAVIEYMLWENSSAYMPPTREYFEVDGVDKDVCGKVLHFNNYRRILHNKKPGPKRKRVYPEEQTFIDGVFRELTTVQDSLSGMRGAKPVDSPLEGASVVSEKMSAQSPAVIPHEEKVSMHEEAPVALAEKHIQKEMTDTQAVEPDTQMPVVGTQAEVSSPAKPEIQAEPVSQEVGQRLNVEQGEDMEEIKTRIMKEYQEIVKEEGQEAAMGWMSGLNLEWTQQDWEIIFEQSDVFVQSEDEMKRKEDAVVQQELAFEDEGEQLIQEEDKGEQLIQEEDKGEQPVQEERKIGPNGRELIDPLNEFDKAMDEMVYSRRDSIAFMNEWYDLLHQLYDKYGRWLIDTNLVKFPARNHPQVPFLRFLKADLAYKCALRPGNAEYPSEEIDADINALLNMREEIYSCIAIWDENNTWLTTYHGFNKVNQGYLDRLSPEEIKRLKIIVYEPEPEVPALNLKERYMAEQRRLRNEKDKMRENGTA